MRARAPGEEGADPGGRLVHLRLRPPPRGGAARRTERSATPRLSRSPALRSSRAAAGAGTARLTAAASPRRALDAPSLKEAAAAGGNSPTRAVTIVRGGRRSRAELLSSRRQPRMARCPFLLPPPALCGGSSQASVLCACARRCQRGAPLPYGRACARPRAPHNPRRRVVPAPPPVHGWETHASRSLHSQAPAAMETRACMHRNICTRTVTRTILTHVRSHTPQTPGATRAHTHTYLPGPRGRIGGRSLT